MTGNSVMPELDIFNLPVFADANIFPMIPPDELAELADDIKENGLNEPLVVGKVGDEWMLIDGRNRLAACKLAGITPDYRIVEADADKLKSLVWSWNGPRRHLSSSQKAMAYAMMYPEPEKGGRGNKLSRNQDSLTPSTKTEKNNIVYARFILKNDREKAELVRDGHPDFPLSKTYDAVKEEAERRKQEAEEQRRKLEQLTALRGDYPDLASLVDEGRIYLDEAIETAEKRTQKAKEEAERFAREQAEELERMAREAAERERCDREAEEAKLAEEERVKREAERQEKERYEANRAAFHLNLSQLLQGAAIIRNPADRNDPAKWKGTWTSFHSRYQISIQEARERIADLQSHIPFILETLEFMRDE